jgi:hypothetical protein
VAHPADPGGIFASDTHRRVLAALSHPDMTWDEDELLERVGGNQWTLIDADEPEALSEILSDLEADGDAKKNKDGWKMTKAGLDKLTAPVASDEEE